jgi:hypothetical protein
MGACSGEEVGTFWASFLFACCSALAFASMGFWLKGMYLFVGL